MGSITGVEVELIGQNGNAFAILGRVQRAMRDAGVDKATIDRYMEEATSGDYDHLLATTVKYVEVS